MFVFIDERTQDTMYLPRMLQIDTGSKDRIKIGENVLNMTVKQSINKSLVHLHAYPEFDRWLMSFHLF